MFATPGRRSTTLRSLVTSSDDSQPPSPSKTPSRNSESPAPAYHIPWSPFAIFSILWSSKNTTDLGRPESFEKRTYALSNIYRIGFLQTFIDTFKKGGMQWFINKLQVILKSTETAIQVGSPEAIAHALFFWKLLALYTICAFASIELDKFLNKALLKECHSNNLYNGHARVYTQTEDTILSHSNYIKHGQSFDTDLKKNSAAIFYYYNITQKSSSLFFDLIVFSWLTSPLTVIIVFSVVTAFSVVHRQLSSKVSSLKQTSVYAQQKAREFLSDRNKPPYNTDANQCVQELANTNLEVSLAKQAQSSFYDRTDRLFFIGILTYCAYFVATGTAPYIWYITTTGTMYKTFKELNKYPRQLSDYSELCSDMINHATHSLQINKNYLPTQISVYNTNTYIHLFGPCMRVMLYSLLFISITSLLLVPTPPITPVFLQAVSYLQAFPLNQLITNTTSLWFSCSLIATLFLGVKENSAAVSAKYLSIALFFLMIFSAIHLGPQLFSLYSQYALNLFMIPSLSLLVLGIVFFDYFLFQTTALVIQTVLTLISQGIVDIIQLPTKGSIQVYKFVQKSARNLLPNGVKYSPKVWSPEGAAHSATTLLTP